MAPRETEGDVFLAGDSATMRKLRVMEICHLNASAGLVCAAIDLEWTISRALMFLSTTPNAELRKTLAGCYSLDSYKELWARELAGRPGFHALPEVVRNWAHVKVAFRERGAVVHGKARQTRNMVKPHMEALFGAVEHLEAYCRECGVVLADRLPVRRLVKGTEPNTAEAHGAG
jgi:hypothetical protein